MENTVNPVLARTIDLFKLIFSRADIYCIIEKLIKQTSDNFEVIIGNQNNLKEYIDNNYTEILERIIENRSTVYIDASKDLLVDKLTGKAYKLGNASANVRFGNLVITNFVYQAQTTANRSLARGASYDERNLSADGAGVVVEDLQFSLEKITTYENGSEVTEIITGNLETPGIRVRFEVIDKPDTFTFDEDNGYIFCAPNPIEEFLTCKVKAYVTYNGKTNEDSPIAVITQNPAHIELDPESVTFESNPTVFKTVTISKSNAIEIVDVSSSQDFCTCGFISDNDNKFQIYADDNNSTSSRTATVTLTYKDGNGTIKTKTVSVNQKGKVETINFYYGGTNSVDNLPNDITGLSKTTSKSFNFTVNLSDKYKLIYAIVPEGYVLNSIKDSDNDPIEINSTYKTIQTSEGAKRIYYSKPALSNISNTYTFNITN